MRDIPTIIITRPACFRPLYMVSRLIACAGVLPFAKRGDDRGNNLIRLQQMFPRIVAAEFQQPLHVSKDCQTLLSRMLTPDPAKRITIGEIMQHPW